MALSDAAGDTVQTYEYSVYGEVAVEDANHPNPYMFAGVRYDIEIGLYYNRARYYNPFMGRFLQTDPVGCAAEFNLYRYCENNPTNRVDPYGKRSLIWGPGEINIDSSCNGIKMCIMPEDANVSDPNSWNCSPTSGQTIEADAVGWYNAGGAVVDGFKVPDNCEAWVYCEADPNDPNWTTVTLKAICAGWLLPSPTPITPGEGGWAPLPPSDEIAGPSAENGG